MGTPGIYESLITRLLQERLEKLEGSYHVARQQLDSAEVAGYLSRFLSHLLLIAFDSLPNGDERLSKQIDLSNALVKWLSDYLNNADLSENLLTSKGEILTALFETTSPVAADLKTHVAKITPQTGLVQSELFTGSNVGLSLESELKREILSSHEICWLVSFIKWTGIRIFSDVLKEAVESGTKIRIITTSYMGATDQKAVDFLSGLSNTEVRLSYNTDRERLHAKAYQRVLDGKKGIKVDNAIFNELFFLKLTDPTGYCNNRDKVNLMMKNKMKKVIPETGASPASLSYSFLTCTISSFFCHQNTEQPARF